MDKIKSILSFKQFVKKLKVSKRDSMVLKACSCDGLAMNTFSNSEAMTILFRDCELEIPQRHAIRDLITDTAKILKENITSRLQQLLKKIIRDSDFSKMNRFQIHT